MHEGRPTALSGILTLALAFPLSDTALAAKARLWYVVDGDTTCVRSEKYVRLIRIDGPKTTDRGGRAVRVCLSGS